MIDLGEAEKRFVDEYSAFQAIGLIDWVISAISGKDKFLITGHSFGNAESNN
jgi:hypothetical protein